MSARSLRLVTPEGVELRLELAGLGERAVALGIDLVIITTMTALLLPVALIASFASLWIGIWALALVGVFLIRHGYFAWFETSWSGATPGKRVLGLRVVRRDGGSLTTAAVLARNLMRDLELFLPLAALIAPDQLVGESPAWLWIPALGWVLVLALLPVISRERTRAGDLVGGTVVIRLPRAALLQDQASRRVLEPLTFTAQQLSIYGEHELETLAMVLHKVDAEAATEEDLRVIARTIARKVGYDGPEPERDPESFLRSFYRSQRAHLEKQLLFGRRKASKHDAGAGRSLGTRTR